VFAAVSHPHSALATHGLLWEHPATQVTHAMVLHA